MLSSKWDISHDMLQKICHARQQMYLIILSNAGTSYAKDLIVDSVIEQMGDGNDVLRQPLFW